MVLSLLLLCLVRAAQAQSIYLVTIDTSPLNGTFGNLDLQFNPGNIDALDATVTITNFLTDGTLDPTSTDSGGAMGPLPGPPDATIENTAVFNDLFQGITFGNSITFEATFSGAALNPSPPLPSSGSVFAVSLYDASGTTPQLTTSGDGSMLHIDLNPDGSTTVERFADGSGAFRANAVPPGVVPEAGALSLLAWGTVPLAGIVFRRRRGP